SSPSIERGRLGGSRQGKNGETRILRYNQISCSSVWRSFLFCAGCDCFHPTFILIFQQLVLLPRTYPSNVFNDKVAIVGIGGRRFKSVFWHLWSTMNQ
ncbi:hypothetical protein M8C21_006865, partial [Ambrosia artemisiifolia]